MKQVKIINCNWRFSKDCKDVPTTLPTDWEIVQLPHTWNALDGQDRKSVV